MSDKSHTIDHRLTSNAASLHSAVLRKGGCLISRTVTVPARAEGARTAKTVEVPLQVVLKDLQSLFILSNQDVVLITNGTTTGNGQKLGDRLSLIGGQPYVWFKGGYFENRFTVDVTRLFLTNMGESDAAVHIEALSV